MTASSGTAMLVWAVLAGAAVLGGGMQLRADEGSPPDASWSAATERPAPSAEEVSRMITLLESVRDYDRLRWVLEAIERQVPPVRGELLQALDAHVQQLFQAEVEQRVASALTSLPSNALEPEPVGAQASAAAQEMTEGEERAWQEKLRRLKPAVDPKDVERQIERLSLAGAPTDVQATLNTVYQDIADVEDSETRKALLQQLDVRRQEAFQAEVAAKRAALEVELRNQATQPGLPVVGN